MLQKVNAIRLNVADASTVATKTVTESAMKASSAAVQMHKEHLEPHLDQHLATLQPHITKAKAMYAEKMDVHVQTVQKQAFEIANHAQTLAPQYYQKLHNFAQQLIHKFGNNKMPIQVNMDTINAQMMQPLEYELGGHVFNFPLGWLDVGLALVQALVMVYVAAKLMYLMTFFSVEVCGEGFGRTRGVPISLQVHPEICAVVHIKGNKDHDLCREERPLLHYQSNFLSFNWCCTCGWSCQVGQTCPARSGCEHSNRLVHCLCHPDPAYLHMLLQVLLKACKLEASR